MFADLWTFFVSILVPKHKSSVLYYRRLISVFKVAYSTSLYVWKFQFCFFVTLHEHYTIVHVARFYFLFLITVVLSYLESWKVQCQCRLFQTSLEKCLLCEYSQSALREESEKRSSSD